MAAASAIVLVIDRLNPGFLGPYGNTWVETPAFNRLAARSLLFETALTDCPDFARAYRSLWSGRPAWTPDLPADAWTLPKGVAAAGVKAALITDEPLLVDHPLAADFDEIIALPPPESRQVEDAQDSGFAQVLQEAIVWLEQHSSPFLLWIHARGLAGPWDAPYAYRERLADEDDPPPPAWLEPPALRLPPDADPDIHLGYSQAYGAQVEMLDECLSAFLQTLDDLPGGRDALLAVTSPRGFPLGEHGRIGTADEALYAELVQVPLFLRRPGPAGEPQRTLEFAQSFDVAAAVAEWGGWAGTGAGASHLWAIQQGTEHPVREAALVVHAGEQALRMPAWYLRERHVGEPTRELFVKPDDRWEMNEVGRRLPAVVEQAAAALQLLQATPDPQHFPRLEAVLIDAWR